MIPKIKVRVERSDKLEKSELRNYITYSDYWHRISKSSKNEVIYHKQIGHLKEGFKEIFKYYFAKTRNDENGLDDEIYFPYKKDLKIIGDNISLAIYSTHIPKTIFANLCGLYEYSTIQQLMAGKSGFRFFTLLKTSIALGIGYQIFFYNKINIDTLIEIAGSDFYKGKELDSYSYNFNALKKFKATGNKKKFVTECVDIFIHIQKDRPDYKINNRRSALIGAIIFSYYIPKPIAFKLGLKIGDSMGVDLVKMYNEAIR